MSWLIYATPFSTPRLIVWDSLRVLTVVCGAVVYVGGIRMIARTGMSSRMALTAALLCLTTSAIGTEIEHLGDVATYRLFFNVTAVLLAGGGMWLAHRET